MRPIRITAVGDVMLDDRVRPPRIFYYQPDAAECQPGFASHFRMPFLNTGESRRFLTTRNQSIYGIMATSHALLTRTIGSSTANPFEKITDHLQAADIVFGNLECPLSDRGRRTANDCCYSASPQDAALMAAAPFHVLSFANNHSFDYGETAFHDTLDALRNRGIGVIGAGRSLEEARAGHQVHVDGTRVAFLGYSMIGADWIYATADECGVAPLNPLITAQDIECARAAADLVFVSVHWGQEEAPMPAPRLIELARYLVDAGADAIFGHHPHVPGSIEIYRQRPIFYSLGNFSFGHDHAAWGDNMIAELEIMEKTITRIDIRAVRGCRQPFLLEGNDARALHESLDRLSRPFGTVTMFHDGKSSIELRA